MTDYHELPEVPRCCLTCTHSRNKHTLTLLCTHLKRVRRRRGVIEYPMVAPHGLCSHWERRDDGG